MQSSIVNLNDPSQRNEYIVLQTTNPGLHSVAIDDLSLFLYRYRDKFDTDTLRFFYNNLDIFQALKLIANMAEEIGAEIRFEMSYDIEEPQTKQMNIILTLKQDYDKILSEWDKFVNSVYKTLKGWIGDETLDKFDIIFRPKDGF